LDQGGLWLNDPNHVFMLKPGARGTSGGAGFTDTISVTQSRPVVGQASWTKDSVAISLQEGPKPVGWLQGLIEKFIPPKNRRSATATLHSGVAVTPAKAMKTPSKKP
jgi:hypothetical protein